MFTTRLLQIAGAGALAATALLAGPTGHALAATPGPESVTMRLSGVLHVEDDDGPGSTPTADKSYGALVTLSASGVNQRKVVTFKSACAGEEVRAELSLELFYIRSENRVTVRASPDVTGLKLFEGTDCAATDLDGTSGFGPVNFLQPNTSTTRPIRAVNGEYGSFDSVETQVKIERLT